MDLRNFKLPQIHWPWHKKSSFETLIQLQMKTGGVFRRGQRAALSLSILKKRCNIKFVKTKWFYEWNECFYGDEDWLMVLPAGVRVPKKAWICSGVLPFVSGSRKMVKKMPKIQKLPNIQKAPELPIASWMSTNVSVTMKAKNQLVNEATEAPGPLTLAGKISPNINHGIGPAPIPKAAMNKMSEVNGNQPSAATCSFSSSVTASSCR